MADAPAPLTADDYQQLYAMLLSPDGPTKAEGLTLAKKLRPDEQQAFFTVQQQATKGRGERVDTNMAEIGGIGIPPEAVVFGPMQAARAGMASGLSMGQRAVAAGGELVSGAAPIVKYEVARHGLQAIGVPSSLATVLAMVWSGRGAAKSTAAEKSVPTLIDEAVARGELRRAPGWTPEQGPLTRPVKPMIAQPEPMAPQPGPVRPPIQVEPPAPVEAPVSAPAAPATGYRFNPTTALADAKAAFQAAGQTPQPGELSWVTTYMKAGLSPDAAVAKALTYRPTPTMSAAETLAQRFGTPSDADVAAIRAAKNARTTKQRGGTKP